MTKITIEIDGDKVTVNQSVTPTKVEKKDKKFFIIIRKDKYDEASWVVFVTDDYITAVNKLKCYNYDTEYIYKLYIQSENEIILPCNGTD